MLPQYLPCGLCLSLPMLMEWQLATPIPSVFRLDCLIHSGALEGSHPVPQPGSGAGARRLQAGLASRKTDVLWGSSSFPFEFLENPILKCYKSSLTCFGNDIPSGPETHITELHSSCLHDCEVIGWAELCERKKLTAGSCFQLQSLGDSGSEECDACGFVAGCLIVWTELDRVVSGIFEIEGAMHCTEHQMLCV